MDPYLDLPDEREERHLQSIPIESNMSVAIASMSIPAAAAASMPALSLSLPTTTVAPKSRWKPMPEMKTNLVLTKRR